MSDSHEIISLEKQFWTAPAAFFEQHLAAAVLMVFPPPIGPQTRAQAIASLAAAPRWAQVDLAHRVVTELSPVACALSYHAAAKRADAAPAYTALVGSVYLREGETWKLAFHQQTPTNAPPATVT
ncbi:hypothetical protein K0B96_14130 [Horticoccus luteus]|uniref:DUF4440 domain-containing protein n=1 Tax=Horticoccus luteus TaxID=2862869 RepID=A0A8F9TVA1_9BACT|nr:hypothetical protein [Horticoccus luteus]QYM78424.1 hypothetical protein K0B96_14130 [Horticoccus luteus]